MHDADLTQFQEISAAEGLLHTLLTRGVVTQQKYALVRIGGTPILYSVYSILYTVLVYSILYTVIVPVSVPVTLRVFFSRGVVISC